ncbi:histidine kinase [Pseudomonas lactis]|uniref:histidine kinase n=1 Tax=Pseudomonas lactis TaxID=1615674 RepID=UPI001FD1CC6F|nr:histidine kinase [Pseudomonas lactis]
MSVEKYLAGFGYNRVAPLSSMRELLVVIENSLSDFDLLIINDSILNSAGVVLEQMVRSCSQIKHFLIYRSDDVQLSSSIGSSASMSFFLPCSPGGEAIRHVMSVVDKVDAQPIYERKEISVRL